MTVKASIYISYGATLLLCSGFAHANDDYFDLSLQELSAITVSSPFPESYLTATSSVSVVNPDFWQLQGARRVADVMAALPSTMTYSSTGSHAIAIRGFANSSGSIRGIATLLDDVPINGYSSGSAMYDKLQWNLDSLSQIQVLRGPSSALYGSDAFHGVIAMQGFHSDHNAQSARAQLGTDRFWRATFNSSEDIGAGWRLDSSVGLAEKPGEDRRYEFTDPTTQQPANGEYAYRYNAQTLMAKLRSPAIAAGACCSGNYGVGIYSNRYVADDHPGMGQLLSPGSSILRQRDHADSDTRFDMVKADAQWFLDVGSELALQTYFWQSQLDALLDATEHPSYRAIQLTHTEENRAGIELKLKQKLAANTDWVLSTSYDRLHIEDRFARLIDPDGSIRLEQRNDSDDASRGIRALVSQFKTHLFDETLTLVYGGRYDDFSDVSGKFTPRAGAIVKLDPRQSVKLLYSRAYRAPTALELYGAIGAQGNLDLNAETIDTAELVYMYQAHDWRSELVVFTSDWDNGIVLAACTVNCGGNRVSYQNVSTSKSHGIEWIVEASFNRWRLRETISYINSSNDTRNASGEWVTSRYSAFPRVIAHLDAGYHFDNNIALYIANALTHNATNGIGSPNNDFSENELPTYWRTDLHLSTQLQSATRVALHVSNLFDRENWRPAVWNTENGLEDAGRVTTLAINHQF